MRFLEYLFFKYYNWQVRVGNGDMPIFATAVSIAFTLMLYCADIVMTYLSFNSSASYHLSKYLFVGVFIVSLIVLYVFFTFKGRGERIMEEHKEEWTGKKNLWAVLFPAIAIVWFIISLFIKAMMNSGMV